MLEEGAENTMPLPSDPSASSRPFDTSAPSSAAGARPPLSPAEEQRKRWLDAAVDVARMAGAQADAYFHKRSSLPVEEKGHRNYVTLADRKTEQLIVEELKLRFPEHAFLGEEGTGAGRNVLAGQPLWVIDPIDGTANFIRGVPLWAVSVGLVVDGVPEVGVIVCPRQDEVFSAARGMGAFLYNQPVQASSTTSLEDATIAIGAPLRTSPIDVVALEEQLMAESADVRRIGSACVAIAWTACGRFDAYVENQLSAWDVAAGLCILSEAGAGMNDILARSWLDEPTPLWCAAPGIAHAVGWIAGV